MPVINVDQFGPDFHVTIKGRQGSNVQDTDINNDIIAISTTRELNSPAGAWAITLISRRDSGGRTWAQRIRPMDYVEINFARYDVKSRTPKNTTSSNSGQGKTDLPIIMRGLVDKVTETVSMSQNGSPFRQTTITGKDMGKLLLIKQVYVLPQLGSTGALIDAILRNGKNPEAIILGDTYEKMTEMKATDTSISPQEFLDRIKKFIYNKDENSGNELSSGVGQAGTNLVEGVPDLKMTAKDMKDLYVSPTMILTFTGPIWNLLQHHQGYPICEIFVHDTKEGPELVWRWAPLKDKDGKIIDPATDPGKATELSLKEIMQYSVSTSDEEVYSLFFVWPQLAQVTSLPVRWDATPDGSGGQGGQGQPGDSSGQEGQNPVYRSELAKRYGFKALEVITPLIRMIDAPLEEDHKDQKTEWQKMGEKMAKWLDKAFNHNANLEKGTIVIRGNEKIDIGTYVKFKETREEFYIEGIRHDFIIWPEPRFTTTLTVTRGLWSDPSPYPDDTGQAGATQGGSGGEIVDPGTGRGANEEGGTPQ